MDELSDEDKMTVYRARKIQDSSRNLSTLWNNLGYEGRYVKIADTIAGSCTLDGKVDHIPEDLFVYTGTIDEVIERFENQKIKINSYSID